jgi:hypothetical protein
MTCAYGFRIVGPCTEPRRLVDAAAAFDAYAGLDPRADVKREAYLSAFRFDEDFRRYLDAHESLRGFAGKCWSPWLWFDIDRADNLDAALVDARRLAAGLVERYRLDDDALFCFFSGAKGCHLGLPTSLWTPAPSTEFHRVARRLAEGIAAKFCVAIDTGVYDLVRPFRAPNSKHPTTGRHKRHLTMDELVGLSLDGILMLAATPAPFDLPTPPAANDQATADWLAAERLTQRQTEANAQRRAAAAGAQTLNRATLLFIGGGAPVGDRHRLLFSAAANLAELSCSPALAHALLTESALDCGLSPSEVRRQIECGLAHVGPIPPATEPAPSTTTSTRAAYDSALQAELAALWSNAKPTLANAIPPDAGDAWEHPLDRLGVIDPAALAFDFGANDPGPYGPEGGRQ